MNENEMLSCLIVFILGFLVARLFRIDRFSISAQSQACKHFLTSGNQEILDQNNKYVNALHDSMMKECSNNCSIDKNKDGSCRPNDSITDNVLKNHYNDFCRNHCKV